MSVFTTPFTTAGNYTYDSNKIEVSGGLAQLKESSLFNGIKLYHRFEEDSWDGTAGEVIDQSSLLNHSTSYNGANTIAGGKIGRGASFDGANDYLVSANNSPITGNVSFSVSFWVYIPSGAAKTGSYSPFLYWGQPATGQAAYISFYGSNLNNIYIGYHGNGGYTPDNPLTYDTWHHIIWVRQGGLNSNIGHWLYVDNVSRYVQFGGATAINIAAGNFYIQKGLSSNGYAQIYQDETCCWNRMLSAGERIELNNSGAGTIINRYSPDNPSIYYTSGHSDVVGIFTDFVVTEGTVDGSLGYQLSEDGITWYYWNGSAWAVATTEYNIKSVVALNISTFPTDADSIFIKTILVSDGMQQVEIDEIQVTYFDNALPNVNPGTNKSCKDNQTIKPFSDTTFNDPDGTIDHVYYKINGEVDVWTEILQGVYASLLEAVNDFNYQFNNVGIITVQLQVEDNVGATADDSLTVTVTKYAKTVNIKDPVTNEHIAAVEFNPGDGTGSTLRNSPFFYEWNYGIFESILQSAGYYSQGESVLVDSEADLNLVMNPISYLNECVASVGWKVSSDTLVITTWLLRGGGVIIAPTSCIINFKDENGNILYTDSSVSAKADGVFEFEKNPSGLPDEGVYRLESSIVYDSITYPTLIPLGSINRRVADFLSDIHDETLGEWILNPDAKTLTLLRIDGSVLKVFDLTDTTRTLPSFIGRIPQ